ncbi:MAG: hypothetical protein KAY31_00290 [Flavobacterium sp.]|nr:hypothetical protein [Flavobacterium sp.]
MKKLKSLAFFALFLSALSFTSCDGDIEPLDPALNPNNGGGGGGTNTPGVFKADFDGQTFSTSSTMVYMSGGSIILNAVKSNGESFSFILNGTTTGTYPANDSFVAYNPAGSEFGYLGFHPTDETANTGSVIVTSIDMVNHTISGTFQFTGYWSDMDVPMEPKTFTNGVFTNLPFTSSNPTGDVFDAKINGTNFVDSDIFVVETEIEMQNYISVAGHNADDDSITVSVRDNLVAGTYPITGGASDVVQIVYNIAPSDFGTKALTGSVTITEKTSTRLKATFTGTVIIDGETYSITQGNFDVEY